MYIYHVVRCEDNIEVGRRVGSAYERLGELMVNNFVKLSFSHFWTRALQGFDIVPLLICTAFM